MPGVLRRRLAPRAALFVAAGALIWLGTVLFGSAAAQALPPAPVPLPTASLIPTAPGGIVGRVDSGVTGLGRRLSQQLAPVLTQVVSGVPSLPAPISEPTLPVHLPLPLPSAPPVPSLPLPLPPPSRVGPKPPIGTRAPGRSPAIRRPDPAAAQAGAGGPAGFVADHPLQASPVARAGAAPLVPIVVPTPPLPTPTPASAAISGWGVSGRDVDLSREIYSGSLVAIRAPPANDRDPAAGVDDDPAFAPD
jgi:hypothetical protein